VLRVRDRFRRAAAPPPQATVLREDELLSSELMTSLRRMRISAPRVQRGTFAGEHRSRRRGTSPEFTDFKSYTPGDDIRRVDWNLYARLDTLFVRVSEVTTDLTVHLVVDSSVSMDWRSDGSPVTKAHFGRQLAAVLGYVTLWHFDRMRVSPFTPGLRAPLGPVSGRTRINELLDYLSMAPVADSIGVGEALHRLGHLVSSPGMLVVISDFLSDEADSVATQVRTLISRGWDVLLVQTLDRAELEPELMFPLGDRNEPVTLVDSESAAEVLLVPGGDAFSTYREGLEPWLAAIAEAARSSGAKYVRLTSDQDLEPTVVHLLHEIGLLA